MATINKAKDIKDPNLKSNNVTDERLLPGIKGVFFKKTIILNIYAANTKDSRYMKQKLIEPQGEIDKSTIKIRDFRIPLSII